LRENESFTRLRGRGNFYDKNHYISFINKPRGGEIMKSLFVVEGMKCMKCVSKVKEALSSVPSVLSVEVTLSPPRVSLESTSLISCEKANQAIRASGEYLLHEMPRETLVLSQRASLFPLYLIVAYLLATVVLITYHENDWSGHRIMSHFMAGFFLIFSFFKLLDLRGFSKAYARYDLIAQSWPRWGILYPFIELLLGSAYIVFSHSITLHTLTMAVMIIGALGVGKSIGRGEEIQCACLGSVLQLPMTRVTLVEDIGMGLMALIMLFT
jgi:copper chaperone CopZ